MNSVKPIHKQMGSVLTITRGQGDNKKGARTSQWMQNEQTCHQYWPQTIKNWPQTLADHFNPIHSLSSWKRMNYILTTFLLLFFDKKLSHLLLLLLQKSCKNKHQPNCFTYSAWKMVFFVQEVFVEGIWGGCTDLRV